MYEVLRPEELVIGKLTYFLIDLTENRIVHSWQEERGGSGGVMVTKEAAALARDNGHEYAIAQVRGFISPPRL